MLCAKPQLSPSENCELIAVQIDGGWDSKMSEAEYPRQPMMGRVRPRLLVVDADAQLQRVFSDVLPVEGCEWVFEVSPDRIEEVLFENAPFDVVLIDLFSPVERLFELIPVLKERCPRAEVIFISRIADEDLWIESIQRGAYDLLPKPLDREELRRILINALERNHSTDELELSKALRASSR
jgi:DNA-binding NtrC family response regulator